MQKIACGLKVALLFFATSLGLVSLLGSQVVYADANSSPDIQPVTITAVCQDENSAMASWRIGNPNPDPVVISWDSGAATGTATASYGFTGWVAGAAGLSVASSVTFSCASRV